MKTFNEYLQDIHADENPTVLDDDMPDSFDDFMGNMDIEEICEYAELYGGYCYIQGKKDMANEANSLASNIN